MKKEAGEEKKGGTAAIDQVIMNLPIPALKPDRGLMTGRLSSRPELVHCWRGVLREKSWPLDCCQHTSTDALLNVS